ncbi:MAG: alpha/beta hydrolase [Gammaproteobacteria bacterium]|nr:alpha/beta hydrolase [Gammaproteobacteria bacterium]MBI5615128.1 alpha/beta hydrolase [Gammaproteobacteria bacterium]
MKALVDHAPGPGEAGALLVLMPGAGITADDFAAHGFTAAVRARNWPVDVAAVATSIDAYVDADFPARLHEEVVVPAGRREVWCAGISAGALGALRYAASHLTQGLLLLSPFIGSRGLIAEIEAAGGLAAWDGGPDREPTIERRLLATLAARAAQPPIYLGYGTADRFVAAHRLLAAVLPAERVVQLPGAHDWPTWEALWTRLLAASGCGPADRTA